MSTHENVSAEKQAARIHWRAWVLSQPGGVDWLVEQGRKFRWKENLIGPETLRWPPSTDNKETL